MSEQTLKCGDVVINKIEFLASKPAIALNLVDTDKIVVYEKFKHSDDDSKYFIGYLHDDDIIRAQYIILPQMSGYTKYFDDDRKSISFKIGDEGVYLEYNEIWNTIKKTLNTRFHSQIIYNDKYIKTKVKTFIGVINTFFSDNRVPKEGNYYICIAVLCTDSILKLDKKNYPQIHLEQCKYKIKRRKMVDFIDAEVGLSSDDLDD